MWTARLWTRVARCRSWGGSGYGAVHPDGHSEVLMDPHDSKRPSAVGETLGERARDQPSERYASMLTHHTHAAYSVDPRGYFTDANQRSLDMTGLSLEEQRQTHCGQVIHPDDQLPMQDAFVRALAGDPQLIEARVVRADGEVVDIRCTAIP